MYYKKYFAIMRLIEDEAKVEVESFFKGIIFSVLIFLLPKY